MEIKVGAFMTLKKEIQFIWEDGCPLDLAVPNEEYSGLCTVRVTDTDKWTRVSFDTTRNGWSLKSKDFEDLLWDEYGEDLGELKDCILDQIHDAAVVAFKADEKKKAYFDEQIEDIKQYY